MAPPSSVLVTFYAPVSLPDTSCDEALARAVAEEEAREAAQAQASAPPLAPESSHDDEVQRLCRVHSAQLSVLPQLIPQTSDLSNTLPGASFSKLVPHVNVYVNEYREARPAVPSARERLDARLDLYNLVERPVKGDGACQFRSLSDQLYRTPRLHAFVRECVVQQLRTFADVYRAFVPDDYESYCSAMSRQSTWGDHVTLQAAADYFGLKICLVTSFESSCFLEIEPQCTRSSRVLWLSFWAEVHYNSVYHDEAPGQLPNEKLLGSRRLYTLLFGPPSPARN